MKLKSLSLIIFLLPVSMTYADTPVAKDSQQVCENRINAFKTSLQNSIDKNQNVEESKATLDKINNLPKSLPPCEKQKQIIELTNYEMPEQTNEVKKGGKTAP